MRLKDRFLAGVVVGIWFTCDGVSLASVETRWVPIEDAYQTPSLYTVYVDLDSISLGGSVVVLRQLTDYLWMQGNAGFGRFGPGPHRFFSTVTRKGLDCANKRVRLLGFTEFSHHMGTEPASINEGLWKIACSHY
jgi:hypothetical protein